jgi:polyisoprenoid-binding protein YceI
MLLSACGTSTTAVSSAPPTDPTPVSSAALTTASAAGVTTLIVNASTSHASYHAQEQLAGRDLPSEAVGTTSDVSGSIVFGPDGSIAVDQSRIQVDLSSLTSDQSRRDSYIQRTTLQTSDFPTATFVPRDAAGLPSPLPTAGQATFQLSGDLTVHGVTKPVTWQVTAQFDGSAVNGSATTNVNISDFGMTPPKAGPVLSLQDGLSLELNFNATLQA